MGFTTLRSFFTCMGCYTVLFGFHDDSMGDCLAFCLLAAGSGFGRESASNNTSPVYQLMGFVSCVTSLVASGLLQLTGKHNAWGPRQGKRASCVLACSDCLSSGDLSVISMVQSN